ncbi:MAG: RdgB/HAM1 family non-canonical purine NTP pyrophosphatase [Heliobacteriaceae bacterium]|nr:RdgB/HAM1 family non-canonical purine NTP pyrophosphatase [Heliobacteriaceae bacterium]MDD4587419.1 RdgB/HAM1 family non-canonical purine NTP pyrophosphatase [Heliobacteriaceae bacterium]
MRVILATRNLGKLREFEALTRDQSPSLPIQWLALNDFPSLPELAEPGPTFRANALGKAEQVVNATGIAALADDSGLMVDALNGLPGINSARFAGVPKNDQRNNEKLIRLLKGIPLERRTARFVCVLALVLPDGQKFTTEGFCEGLIAEEMCGQGGFGYDPLFFLPGYGQTFAELSQMLKNAISHRAVAMEKMRFLLQVLLFPEPEPLRRPNF